MKWILIAILFVLHYSIGAQTPDYLFEVVDTSTVNLSNAEQNRFDEIIEDSLTESVLLIELSKVKDIVDGDSVVIELDSTEYSFFTRTIYQYSDGSYYWYSEYTENQDLCGGYGVIKLFYDSLGHVGNMILDTTKYRIQRLSEEYNVLQELDLSKIETCETSTDTVEFTGDKTINLRTGNCDIHVLALYTETALDDEPALISELKLAMEDGNQALFNSTITSDEAKFVILGVEETTWEETNDAGNDLDSLQNDDDVADWIEEYDPDVVVVIVGSTSYSLIGGKAYEIGVTDPDESFVVVEADVINNGDNVVPHEIVHLIGGYHQQSSIETSGSHSSSTYSHGYGTKTGCSDKTYRRTIMHANTGDGSFINYFSDPDLKFKGKNIGRVDSNDVVRLLENEGCNFADLRDNTSRLTVDITGLDEGYPFDRIELGSSVSGGGVGAYTYDWKQSTDGFTFGSTISTTSSVEIDLPSTVGAIITVRLTVTSTDSQVVDAFHFILVVQRHNLVGVNAPDNEINFEMYPNPTNGEISLKFNLKNAGKIECYLTDAEGRIVYFIFDEYFERGYHTVINNLPIKNSGTYFVNFRTKEGIYSKTLKFYGNNNISDFDIYCCFMFD